MFKKALFDFGRVLDTGTKAVEGSYDLLTTMLPLTAIAAGYGLAKMKSPTVVADKDISHSELTDNDIILSALDSEIAATKRKLAILNKEDRLKQSKKPQVIFDKASGTSVKVM